MKNDRGLLHLYWGDGKGKTTAAVGLAVRAAGSGKKVVFLQFLKDGTSSEIAMLEKLGVTVIAGMPEKRFVFQMNDEEKERTRAAQMHNLERALTIPCDVLVLDEACGALALRMIDEALLKDTVLNRPAGQEMVLTGRNPAEWMRDAADYCTEMHCWNHPYQSGIGARAGIEY